MTDQDPPGTMPAVVHDRYGPPEVLRVTRLPVPSPGRAEVVLRVRAVAVERAACAMRAAEPALVRVATGLLRPRRPVLGGDIGGEVLEVGPGVDDVRAGDRVVAVSFHGGGYAERAVVPAAGVVRVPDGLPLEEAVAVMEGGLTALPFLRDHAGVGPGTRLMVNGAAGAVGVMAVQLAVHLGATVTGVCSTRSVELVRSLGAHRVVDRTVDDATDPPEPYDVVLDAVGALGFRRARRALATNGHYLTTVPSRAIGPQMLWTRVRRGKRATLATTGLRPVGLKAADVRYLLDLADRRVVRAVVDSTYPLVDVVDAHHRVETGRKCGSVLLVP